MWTVSTTKGMPLFQVSEKLGHPLLPVSNFVGTVYPATATSTPRWAHSPLARPLALREVSIMRHDNPSETSLVRSETPDHRVMLKALG